MIEGKGTFARFKLKLASYLRNSNPREFLVPESFFFFFFFAQSSPLILSLLVLSYMSKAGS